MFKKTTLLMSIVLVILLTSCSTNNAARTSNYGANSDIIPEDEVVIKATNFEFDQEEYHLKKGVPVKIIFENESGNHGILVPELKLQLNNKNSSQVIIPEEAGTFELTCSIMCGSGHSGMKAMVIVE